MMEKITRPAKKEVAIFDTATINESLWKKQQAIMAEFQLYVVFLTHL